MIILPRLALLLLVAGLALGCRGTDADGAAGRPNVVLIVTDDQGCGDVAFTGNDVLRTPHLNRLADEGTTFTSFYVAPVCAPTRASLLTGRYHQRTGVRGVIEGREFMVEAETTAAEVLAAAGYATGLFGKWHLGENYPWVPRAQGFDEFVGFLDGSHPYFDADLVRNGEPYPTEGYLTDVLTDHALEFVERHAEEDFFVYLSFNAPHSPLEVPEAYVRPYDHLPHHTALIYGMMAAVDENVGRLVRRLDDLGLADETLVLFLSDNGPLFGGGGYDRADRFNCGLRGQKYTVQEGGIRVPLVARWPGRVAAGARIEAVTAHIDLLPTLADYAGVEPPDAIDGRSLRPLLDGDQEWPARTLFMSYPGEAGQRHAAPAPYPGGMARAGRYKMIDGEELYDLVADPGESIDLAAEHPDVLRRLDAAYREFWQAVTSERPPYPRVQVGHAEENPTTLTAHWALLSGNLAFRFADDPVRYRGVGVHGDRIGRWHEGGAATWRLTLVHDASYRLLIRSACTGAGSGGRVTASIRDATLRRDLPACSGGGWVDQELGVVALPAGEADLSLSIADAPPDVQVENVIVERL